MHDASRLLERGQAAAAVRTNGVVVYPVAHHVGGNDLSPLRIRRTGHGRFYHAVDLEDRFFHLAGVHVVTATDDELLGSTHDAVVAGIVDFTNVAASEPAVHEGGLCCV